MRNRAKALNSIIVAEMKRLKATGRFEYNDDLHEYRMDGIVVPSVTKFISPGIPEELLYNSNFIRKTRIGTDTHHVSEALNAKYALDPKKAKAPKVLPEGTDPYVAGYVKFLREAGYTIVAWEIRVHSLTHKFAGTLDILALDPKGRLTIMDIKTTAKLSPTVGLQLAGYKRCFDEMYYSIIGEKVLRREIIWLTGDDDYKIKAYSDSTDDSVLMAKLVGFKWDKKHNLR